MRRLVFLFAFAMATPMAAAEPPHHGDHEYLNERPSGFWTSNAPALNGAYKYRLLGVGCAVALLTGWLTWRLVKNTRPRRIGQ